MSLGGNFQVDFPSGSWLHTIGSQMMCVIHYDFLKSHITRVMKVLWFSFQPNSALLLQKAFASIHFI